MPGLNIETNPVNLYWSIFALYNMKCKVQYIVESLNNNKRFYAFTEFRNIAW